MPSSYSTSLRFNLQATGENTNTWGALLNTGALSLIDAAIAGWTTIALSGDLTLSTANGMSDQARMAMPKFTGTGPYTVTIPAVSKAYDVWNAMTGVLTVTNGSASVTIQPGEVVRIVNDGGANFKRVQPTDFASSRITSVGSPTANSDAATKLYVDNTAFATMSGSFPGMTGNAGKVLTNDGNVTASWTTTLASFTLTAPTVTGGQTLSGGQTMTGSTKQNVTAVSLLDLDLSTADFFTKSISTSSTFTFSNATASEAQAFALKLTISSSAAPTWPATVKWANGTSPTLGNGTHVLGFLTFDGGASWTGLLAAFNQS